MWDGCNINFVIKCELNELVECEIYLSIIVNMKYDNYYGMDQNGKKVTIIMRRRE